MFKMFKKITDNFHYFTLHGSNEALSFFAFMFLGIPVGIIALISNAHERRVTGHTPIRW